MTLLLVAILIGAGPTQAQDRVPRYQMSPIGWVRQVDGKTYLEIDARYTPGLLGLGPGTSLWVLYWFDRNDTPSQRAILQVHPRGDPDQPVRGVFATRSPFRPNLVGLSQVGILSVQDNRIEIDNIDTFPDTPLLDLKPVKPLEPPWINP